MADTSVKYFDSTMSGAPVLSGAVAGTLIPVLEACLENGFGTVTVNSLVVASNVATATISAGHNLSMLGTTGPVIDISGATPSSLNGQWRVASIPNSTTLTFATTGISDQTATGTITAKRAPAGWTKVFTGTNRAAYRANSLTSTQLFFRIDDSNANYSRVRGYESISDQAAFDADTATNPFPTDAQISGGAFLLKGSTSARPWAVIADHAGIYIFIDESTNSWQSSMFFGDFNSYVSPDAYCCMLSAHTTNNVLSSQLSLIGVSAGWTARGYNQLSGSTIQNRYSHRITLSNLGTGGQAYKAPADNSFHGWPIEVWDGATVARGLMPGAWNPIHNNNITNRTVVSNIPQLPGRDLFVQSIRVGQIAIDITGPWR